MNFCVLVSFSCKEPKSLSVCRDFQIPEKSGVGLKINLATTPPIIQPNPDPKKNAAASCSASIDLVFDLGRNDLWFQMKFEKSHLQIKTVPTCHSPWPDFAAQRPWSARSHLPKLQFKHMDTHGWQVGPSELRADISPTRSHRSVIGSSTGSGLGLEGRRRREDEKIADYMIRLNPRMM